MEVKAKRFFSKVAGSQYIMPDGFAVVFAHGHYDFDPAKHSGTVNIPAMNGQSHAMHGKPKAQVYFEELEHLVTSNNPLVFDQEHLTGVAATLPAELDPTKNAHSEADVARAESALARTPGRVTGEPNNGSNGSPSDVNASTIDPKLQQQVFKPVGPGAAAAVAAAKARSVQNSQTVAANSRNGVAQ